MYTNVSGVLKLQYVLKFSCALELQCEPQSDDEVGLKEKPEDTRYITKE